MSPQLREVLPDWLPHQRWFGAKGRPIESVTVLTERDLVVGDPGCRHALVEVDLGEDQEIYQLLVGYRPHLPEKLKHARIGRVGSEVFYDATHDNELTNLVLQLLASGADDDGLRFRHLPDVELHTELTGIVISAEQSNTSIVFGEEYILKLFRKVSPGINPDLEITRALAEAGCSSIVPPLAWLETDVKDQ